MSSFLQDLKGSFGIFANPDVISYLMRGLMFTLAISIIAIAVSLVLGDNPCADEELLHTRGGAHPAENRFHIY